MTTTLSISCSELCGFEGMSEQLIIEAIEHGVINPIEGVELTNWVFDITDIVWFKKAMRLQKDLDLDWISIALVVDLLQKQELLEHENKFLRQRLDRFISEI